MTDSREQDRLDRDLWQRFSAQTPRAASREELDPNLLAAFLDGTASAEEVEQTERAMLSDRGLVETVGELRQLLSPEPDQVPETARSRARSLFRVEAPPRRKVLRGTWRAAAQWIAAAAAILAISAWGYWLGQSTSTMHLQAASIVPSPLALELDEDDGSADLWNADGGNGLGGVL